jgi:alanyl-tRNA synthetase
MTSTQIRQSFLDFFKSKQHTIVPSSSLMPDSPNLLFTNAGMNQFVPIFLGQTKCPYTPGRAADTQKCIRAGGKHNDLDDVGLDTYHHTFFEMLGNWSFGDYFKQEAINWAWELVIDVWKFPPSRLYATVYNPDKSKGDPSEFDQDAWNFWAEKFRSVGLDPAIHVVNGNKKDNFWMMGETGPCGPCSELHVDLTPDGNTHGKLVNTGDARCIEIWNNVFIQFNANPDGSFSPLPAKHVDTGMGFERVTSIIQGTKNLTNFKDAKISNYETDIFRPIFDAIEKLSGKRYGSTLPKPGSTGDTEQEKADVAFRVIADHIRTLSFAIADGIQPGNNDRNYVLRRILRRAVRYGRTLGFHEPFFYKLVDVLADTMGDVFPEIRAKKKHVQDVIRTEEESFNRTLDEGLRIFEQIISIKRAMPVLVNDLAGRFELLDETRALGMTHLQEAAVRGLGDAADIFLRDLETIDRELVNRILAREDLSRVVQAAQALIQLLRNSEIKLTDPDQLPRVRTAAENFRAAFIETAKVARGLTGKINGPAAFLLYDTFGFPLDLTELMARERGMTVDTEGFEKLMEEQRARARAAQKKEVISLSQIETTTPTKFVGFDNLAVSAKVVEVVSLRDKTAIILDTSACYAEMGGQVGDTGQLYVAADVSLRQTSPATEISAALSRVRPRWNITNTQKSGNTWLHFVDGENIPASGDEVVLQVDVPRRNAIQRHHTVTHLLHWALHEVVSKEASQKGSFVGPDKLTFDFNSAALTPVQVADIEKLVNERIVENAGVSWSEVPYAEVKKNANIMQFFGDKYGDTVRVVQIGGAAGKFDGYSMELCGGTHTRATGEIGLFRIVGESAIAAGVRRIEAVAGLTAYDVMKHDRELIKAVAGKVNSPIHELEKKIESLLAQQKALVKEVQIAMQRNASNAASELLERVQAANGIPCITHNLGEANGDFLQAIADALKSRFKGVVVLGGYGTGSVTLIATVSSDFTAKVQAGKIIQTIAPIVGGKGGGKPDHARGGGKDATKLDEALAKAKSLLG